MPWSRIFFVAFLVTKCVCTKSSSLRPTMIQFYCCTKWLFAQHRFAWNRLKMDWDKNSKFFFFRAALHEKCRCANKNRFKAKCHRLSSRTTKTRPPQVYLICCFCKILLRTLFAQHKYIRNRRASNGKVKARKAKREIRCVCFFLLLLLLLLHHPFHKDWHCGSTCVHCRGATVVNACNMHIARNAL